MSACEICPRHCASREMGVCRAPQAAVVAKTMMHDWEEPCLFHSGAVFFAGCNLRCVYCQNAKISQTCEGERCTPQQLAELYLSLQAQGANNLNLITATHFGPQVAMSLWIAKDRGLSIPVVYNTSGYETVDAIRAFEGLVDVYLPDYKYADAARAEKYSRAKDYPEVAMAAIAEMVRQHPAPTFDADGKMLSGVIVRHLCLPGGREDTKKALWQLHKAFGDRIYCSILKQYTPMPGVAFPELTRKLRRSEYARIVDYAMDIGITQAFIQEGTNARESFIPDFDR